MVALVTRAYPFGFCTVSTTWKLGVALQFTAMVVVSRRSEEKLSHGTYPDSPVPAVVTCFSSSRDSDHTSEAR